MSEDIFRDPRQASRTATPAAKKVERIPVPTPAARVVHQAPGTFTPDPAMAQQISEFLITNAIPMPGPLVGGLHEQGMRKFGNNDPDTLERLKQLRSVAPPRMGKVSR